MTLISCPECGVEVSRKASQCQACGYPLRRELLKDKLLLWGSRLGMAVAGLLIVLLAIQQIEEQLDRMNSIDRSGAISACLDSVGEKKTLATLGRLGKPHFGSLGSGRYLVDGEIRLEYSGGFDKTDTYRCVMRQDSSGYWTVMSAEIR